MNAYTIQIEVQVIASSEESALETVYDAISQEDLDIKNVEVIAHEIYS